MKRIKAYVLAADPTWLERSVGAYYPFVDEIVVSYDRSSRGWTGAPVPVEECLTRLRVLDGDGKMRFCPGDFSSPVQDPMENDTLQRGVALQLASQEADWVLQLDTDEWGRWCGMADEGPLSEAGNSRGFGSVRSGRGGSF